MSDRLLCEARVLRQLAETTASPGIRAYIPRIRDYVAETGQLVLEAILPSLTLHEVVSHGYDQTTCAQSARQIGAALAELHSTHTEGLDLESPRPWLLTLLEQEDSTPRQGLESVLERIKRCAPLRTFTDELGHRWPGDVMIHGDVRFSNVLSVSDPPYLRLLDWELAGLGDPLYDLGCLLAAVLAEAAARGTNLQSAINYFSLSYAEYRGRACQLSGAAPILVGYAALRLAQLSIEHSKNSFSNNDHCGRILTTAERLSETSSGSLGTAVLDAVSSIERDENVGDRRNRTEGL